MPIDFLQNPIDEFLAQRRDIRVNRRRDKPRKIRHDQATSTIHNDLN